MATNNSKIEQIVTTTLHHNGHWDAEYGWQVAQIYKVI